ncbi:MAG: imidazole glycerol phosphate synthase subunit HisF [Flavobacteriales bacterium]|nr:imidazole glycerol phosphate synthase subunit HisF [Bacteroidota bacterium]MCB9239872.1 imidazole glycerol phosphate synthase subunit HisF [Flavobacteriales bacterium]
MIQNRLIPVLLLKGEGLVKTVKFKKPVYVGDPINAVKIFNDKEVDELVFLDIMASKERRGPNFKRLQSISTECFMPLGYGGGITKIEEIERIFQIGIEKVILNHSALESPQLIKDAVTLSGSQSVVGSVDYSIGLIGGRKLYDHVSGKAMKQNLMDHINRMVEAGIGELMLNCVNRDGMRNGYDVEFINEVAAQISIPVIGAGGAGSVEDIKSLLKDGHVSAAAAGSMFVFHGPHKAVLINYPNQEKIKNIFS